MTYTTDAEDDARRALGRTRRAWTWITDATTPATGPRQQPTRWRPPPDPHTALTAARVNRAVRAEYVLTVARGAKPSAPGRLPVDAHAVDVRHTTARTISAIAAHTWQHLRDHGHAATITYQPTPTAGSGDCLACRRPRRCGCDRADLTVALALTTIADHLGHLPAHTLTTITDRLDQAAARAERAADAGPDQRRIPGSPECPTCGTRDLFADVTSVDPREWAVRCGNRLCVCTGPTCPCGHGTTRREGRRHRWPSRRWDGPDGLAARLGVAGPDARATFETWLAGVADQALTLHVATLHRAAAAAGRTLPITTKDTRCRR